MNKYIEANKILAELERRIGICKRVTEDERNEEDMKLYYMGKVVALEEIRHLASYLQQEQPDNWDDEYREDELLTRFAFYTYKDEDSVLYLSNVFVEETSRNKGFGTKILAAAEKVAETIGAINIRLKAKKDSPANSWYRKHGYGYMTFEGDYDWLEKKLDLQQRENIYDGTFLGWVKEKMNINLEEADKKNDKFLYGIATGFAAVLDKLKARKEK